MTQPVYYMQTDTRWASNDYSAKGETTNVAKSGCGPTCAAMVIASLKDTSVTPAVTAKWSLARGYKACKQGTYYSYFVPQLKAYGITARQLNKINNYKSSDQAKLRSSVQSYLQKGCWIIACMGKGTWTSSGHFVLAWGMEGGKVCINDPYSKASARTRGNLSAFLNEAKYFWLIEGTGGGTASGNGYTVEITKAEWNLRKAPDTKSDVVQVLKKGDRVQIIGGKNGWLMNNYGYWLSEKGTKVV